MSAANGQNGDGPERLASEPAAPDTRSWYEHMWQTQQQTPQRLEDCAKFLATILGITVTLLVTVGKTTLEQGRLQGASGMAAGLCLVALVLCLLVAFPWPYRYADCSVQSMKKAHRKIVRYKYAVLVSAAVLFVLAMAILVAGLVR